MRTMMSRRDGWTPGTRAGSRIECQTELDARPRNVRGLAAKLLAAPQLREDAQQRQKQARCRRDVQRASARASIKDVVEAHQSWPAAGARSGLPGATAERYAPTGPR